MASTLLAFCYEVLLISRWSVLTVLKPACCFFQSQISIIQKCHTYYTGCPRNSAQTLHSDIPRWEYIKDAQKNLPVQATIYEKNTKKTVWYHSRCKEKTLYLMHKHPYLRVFLDDNVKNARYVYRVMHVRALKWRDGGIHDNHTRNIRSCKMQPFKQEFNGSLMSFHGRRMHLAICAAHSLVLSSGKNIQVLLLKRQIKFFFVCFLVNSWSYKYSFFRYFLCTPNEESGCAVFECYFGNTLYRRQKL